MDSRNPLLMDLRQRDVQLEAQLDRFMEHMDRRFAQIDWRFAHVDARIDQLNRKIDAQGLKRIDSQSLKNLERQGLSLTDEMTMQYWWFAAIVLTGSITVAVVILSQ